MGGTTGVLVREIICSLPKLYAYCVQQLAAIHTSQKEKSVERSLISLTLKPHPRTNTDCAHITDHGSATSMYRVQGVVHITDPGSATSMYRVQTVLISRVCYPEPCTRVQGTGCSPYH